MLGFGTKLFHGEFVMRSVLGEFLSIFSFPPDSVYNENKFWLLNEVLDTWKVCRKQSLFSFINEKRHFMWEEVVPEAIMTYFKLAVLAKLLPHSYSWRTTDT
jgi:hypothetical protein